MEIRASQGPVGTRGGGGVDGGALCLSWLGCDRFAPRAPPLDRLATGQAQGPHPAPHPPLVPTALQKKHGCINRWCPPCPTSAPCPYSTGNARYPIRSSKIIRLSRLLYFSCGSISVQLEAPSLPPYSQYHSHYSRVRDH